MIYSVSIAEQVEPHTHTHTHTTCICRGAVCNIIFVFFCFFFCRYPASSPSCCILLCCSSLHHYPSPSPCISAYPSPNQTAGLDGCVCVCARVCVCTLPAGGSSRGGCSLGKWRTVCSLLLLENRQCIISLCSLPFVSCEFLLLCFF